MGARLVKKNFGDKTNRHSSAHFASRPPNKSLDNPKMFFVRSFGEKCFFVQKPNLTRAPISLLDRPISRLTTQKCFLSVRLVKYVFLCSNQTLLERPNCFLADHLPVCAPIRRPGYVFGPSLVKIGVYSQITMLDRVAIGSHKRPLGG